jgi:hypothetical protein
MQPMRASRGIVFAAVAFLVAVFLLVLRLPAIAGYRDLGVIDGAPSRALIGIDPFLTVSRSADETAAIWRGLDTTLWESPKPAGPEPDVDYAREVLALATVFESSSCAPSLAQVAFVDGGATVEIAPWRGTGGCSADAVSYTFVVAIARDRLAAPDAEIRMAPTLRPG